jgi:hypothetical protein
MTTQTMFEATTETPISERFKGTALDPVKGRAREFRVIFAFTLMVLVPLFALGRAYALLRHGPRPRRSFVQEARCAALSALAYAYRH